MTEGLPNAWDRGYSFAYWQERGYGDRDDIPDHLTDQLREWNPYRANVKEADHG